MIFCNTVIIENEQKTSNLLRFYLKEYCPELEILAICKTIEDAVETISALKPDIVFLDLDLNDENGFTVLDKLKNINFEIIVTARNKDAAHKAFEYNATHFLLKPFYPLELRKAVNRAIRNKLAFEKANKHESEVIKYTPGDNIQYETNNTIYKVSTQDIVYIQSNGNQCIIVLKSGQRHISDKILKKYGNKLIKNNFYRISHSHLINLDYVTRLNENKNLQAIEMVNGDLIRISNGHQQEFKTLMKEFIANI